VFVEIARITRSCPGKGVISPLFQKTIFADSIACLLSGGTANLPQPVYGCYPV
jgi:hypothetical protein